MERPDALRNQGRVTVGVNDISVELLVTDSGIALTFLDLADSTTIESDRARRIDEAHTAYRTIVTLLPRFIPTPEQKRTLDENLNLLRTRLVAAGVPLAQEGTGAGRPPQTPA